MKVITSLIHICNIVTLLLITTIPSFSQTEKWDWIKNIEEDIAFVYEIPLNVAHNVLKYNFLSLSETEINKIIHSTKKELEGEQTILKHAIDHGLYNMYIKRAIVNEDSIVQYICYYYKNNRLPHLTIDSLFYEGPQLMTELGFKKGKPMKQHITEEISNKEFLIWSNYLESEFEKYPKSLLLDILYSVDLYQSLGDKSLTGVSSGEYGIDIEVCRDSLAVVHTLHHEISHQIDRKVYRESIEKIWYLYGEYYSENKEYNLELDNEKHLKFSTPYSQVSIGEELAEISGYLFTGNSTYYQDEPLIIWIEKNPDTILADKVEIIIRGLNQYVDNRYTKEYFKSIVKY